MKDNILIGDFTFVENTQSDYESLYQAYNVDEFNAYDENVLFVIVHKIDSFVEYSVEALDRIQDEGLSYLIPAKYNGVVIYENQR